MKAGLLEQNRARRTRKANRNSSRTSSTRLRLFEELESRRVLFGPPQLLGDIGVSSSHIGELTTIGATTYFVASAPGVGIELWKTDGTAGGTSLVKDILPGVDGSHPRSLTNVGGTLYFSATHETDGVELWKSDGTEAGTVMVRDINDGVTGSYPSGLVELGGELFFEANDGIYGRELWKSDGSEAGTVLVRDINPLGNSNPDQMIVAGSNIYFRATGPEGREVWISDGTTGGTSLLKDIDPAGDSNPNSFVAVGGTVYFNASDGTHGDELWKTDGTELGTELVKDIFPGPLGGNPNGLTSFNGLLFFAAIGESNNFELWKSDGSEAGTTLFKELNPTGSSSPGRMTVIGSTMYFRASDGVAGYELWKSDGTEVGTVLVKDINPGPESSNPLNFVELGGEVYFSAYEASLGSELWKTDGTDPGTVLVKDIEVGSPSSYPQYLTVAGGSLLFSAIGNNTLSLFKSDGTAGGTEALANFASDRDSFPTEMTQFGDLVFFNAANASGGYELWKSDGTSAGTVLVKDIRPGAFNGSYPRNMEVSNGSLFLQAINDTHGTELWKTDGTEAGTVMVKDINPGPGDASPSYLRDVNGTLFFSATDGTNGYELWKSDGTEAGTVMVKDINPGPDDSAPLYLTNVNGTLFFVAKDGANGYELWKSDGTEGGTVLVKDIQLGPNNSAISEMTSFNGELFFIATDGTYGRELWKSDGSEAGTVMVKDINVGPGFSQPASLTVVGSTLFFRAYDSASGYELWKTDGTEAGTVLVKDIRSGTDGSSLGQFAKFGGSLAFMADDGNVGKELWISDGTEAGTVLVKDINPGPGDSYPFYLTTANGILFFSADDNAAGRELWQSDGTEAGTQMVADILPGGAGAFPSSLTNVQGDLFFTASDGITGNELWVLLADKELTVSIVADSISENGGSTTATVTRTNVDGPLTVDLISSDTGEAIVIASIVIPDGETTSAPFTIDAVDDQLFDGTQTVTITASAARYVSGSDTLDVSDHETLDVVIVATSIAENGGAAATTATVTRSNTDIGLDLVVTLTNGDPSAISIPATVTILANETSVTFDIGAVDDDVLDGTQTVNITASATGYESGSDSIDVTDHETLSVVIAAASITENAGVAATTVTVTRSNTDISQDLVVTLTNGDSTEILIPATVTIAANETSVTFDIDAVDDDLLDGTQTVSITASATGYVDGDDTVDVADHETLTLVISADSVAENAGAAATTATVTRSNSDNTLPLIVTLTNGDATEIGIPLTVTIPANESSVTFDIDAVDDTLLDGIRTASITASAAGYESSSDTIDVTDHETISIVITAASVAENSGVAATTATVTRSTSDLSQPLVVTLDNSDASAILIPATVTIPANEAFVVFDIDAVDDDLLDGTQTVTITASATDYLSGSDSLDVTDHEVLTIVIAADSIAENAGAAATTVTITRGNTDITQDLVVILTNGDASELDIPATVTIPANESSLTFDMGATDDDLLDGTQTVTITASAAGYESSSDSLEVTDHETLIVAIAAAAVSEDAGLAATTLTVTRSNTDNALQLEVTLTNSDSTAITIPTTVIIPANESSVTIDVDVVDDDLLDGTQTVTVTASAVGYESGSDAIDVTDHELLTLVIAAGSIAENGGAAATTATVTRGNSDISQPLVVSLGNSDASEIDIPLTVTIPANESSITFDIAALDDDLLDGTQSVTITASAAGYVSATDTVDVTDHETLTIVIAAASIAENAGAAAATATVTRSNSDHSLPLVVTLTNGDSTEIDIPTTVVIPANESSVTFDIDALDDDLLDGTQTVTISVDAADYVLVSDSIDVTDHETLSITIVAASIAENAGAAATTATVTRNNSDIDQPLVVTLAGDNSEIDIPATVTIPANESSVTFDIGAVDDALLDGLQTVSITASATGYESASDTIDVTDHESLSLVITVDSVLENGGATATTATVTRSNSDDTSLPLVVDLSHDGPLAISIPATVTIPANATSITFNIAAIDDDVLDGTQSVVITAAAAGYESATDTLDVLDHETLTVSIAAASLSEAAGAAATTATVTRSNTDNSLELIVTLINSDDSEITIPTTVTIPANESSVTFDIDVLDDALLDGTQTVTISATATGYVSVDDSIDVTDDETLVFVIAAASIAENAGAGATTATVSRTNSDLSQPLVVTLLSSDPSEVAVPATVTIPANEASVTFALTAVDDDLLDGTQTVSITASATGYASATDSIDVTDHEFLTITFAVASIAENAGAAGTTATVTRSNTDNSLELVVTLTNSANTAITVPATVTIPANESSITFDIDVVDDDVLDGTQVATLTASATNYASDSDSLDVLDHETLTVVIAVASIAENAGSSATTATVTRGNSDISLPLVVTLNNGDTSELSMPTTVTIPANETSVLFEIGAIDDDLLDGTQTVTITATATGYASVSDTLDVTDHETLTIAIAAASIAENAGANATTATVTRGNSDISQALVVTLTNSDAGELTVPATVTIPANEASVTFNLSAVDDNLLDGTQTVTLTATAAGYVSSSDTVEVTDHETLSLTIVASSILENAGAVATTATVTRSNSGVTQALLVTLTNSDPTGIGIPATVTIPANQSSVTFDIAAVEDTLLDGTQTVTITASAAGYVSASDSLEVQDHELLTISIAAASIAENAGTAATAATVTRGNSDISQPLVVTLNNGDASEISIPATVTIPANQSSVTFRIDAADDTLLDGVQNVTITASASGYVSGSDSLDVTDHESLSLTIAATSVAENAGATATTATVTRSNTDIGGPLLVTLINGDPNTIQIPSTVTIPANQASVTFDVAVTDNTFLDGSRTVIISASAAAYSSGTDSLVVTDHESLTVAIVAASIGENGGPGATTATVTRSNTDISQPLVVTLSSSDTTEIAIPATVTIPANQASATFSIEAIDDTLLDGTQTVTIHATANGYTSVDDTVDVTDHETLTLAIVAASIQENAGAAATTATVTRSNTDNSLPLVVTLTNSDASEISIPVTVTIPANQSSVTFDIAAVNDDLLDGTQPVTITAAANGYVSGSDAMEVTDHETLTIVIAAAAIAENAGAAATTATVTRSNSDTSQPLTVTLANGDASEINIPATVTIPANQSSATFDIAAVNDNLLDGTQSVTITATATGYVSSADTVDVTDHETLTITIAVGSISENAGNAATTATVIRSNTDNSQPLVVTLTGSDASEITIPTTVTIPANQASVTFDIAAVDDTLLDGTQTVQIIASASNYESASASLDVLDHEQLVIQFLDADIIEGQSTTVTITRTQQNIGQSLTVALSVTGGTGLVIPASVVIPANATSVSFQLTADYNSGGTTSQTLNVVATAAGYASSSGAIQVTDNPAPWQNLDNRFDSNLDGQVTPQDVLVIINELNDPKFIGPDGSLPDSRALDGSQFAYDVNGDGFVTPIDALVIINRLNGVSGEGESAQPETPTGGNDLVGAVDSLFAELDRSEDSNDPSNEDSSVSDAAWAADANDPWYSSRRSDADKVVSKPETGDDDQESLLDALVDDVSNQWFGGA